MRRLDEALRFVVQFRVSLPLARQQATQAGARGLRRLIGTPAYAAAFSMTFLDMQVTTTADRLFRLSDRMIPELQRGSA